MDLSVIYLTNITFAYLAMNYVKQKIWVTAFTEHVIEAKTFIQHLQMIDGWLWRLPGRTTAIENDIKRKQGKIGKSKLLSS